MLLHIGYPKTGTTWLQERLFIDEEVGFTSPLTIEQLVSGIVVPHPLEFSPGACRESYEASIKAAQKSGIVPVVSRERFAGASFAGGYDSKEMADRLFAVFSEARVLLVIRGQNSIIYSQFKHYVQKGGALSLGHWLSPPGDTELRIPQFNLDYYCYDRLIAYYQTLFGAERLLVMPYEEFREDPIQFTERVCRFAGQNPPSQRIKDRDYYRLKVNESVTSVESIVLRLVNRYFGRRSTINQTPMFDSYTLRRIGQKCASGFSAAIPARHHKRLDKQFQDEITETVGDYYAASNQRTMALTGEDLARYRYDMGV